MIRTFEAFLAAIIIVSFLFYLSPSYFHASETYNNSRISYDEYYGCFVTNGEVIGNFNQSNVKLLILEFNKSLENSCVEVPIYSNRTYAFSNGFIPSYGGKNITVEMEDYREENPIFVYIRNGSVESFKCSFPHENVNFNHIIVNTNYKEVCGEFDVIR